MKNNKPLEEMSVTYVKSINENAKRFFRWMVCFVSLECVCARNIDVFVCLYLIYFVTKTVNVTVSDHIITDVIGAK